MLRDAAGKTLTPLLIFDQFEEIFTLAQDDDFGRKRAAQFIEDLADLVENRAARGARGEDRARRRRRRALRLQRAPTTAILIALREDYLAHLEGLKGAMPSITQNRMRLARMTGEQALAAVMKPGGKLVSEEVAESIVRFIAGGSELRNAEVEPSLLSLVCRELNNTRIAQGRAEISADLLAGSRDTILARVLRARARRPAGGRAPASSRTRCSPSRAFARASPRSACARPSPRRARRRTRLPTLVNRRLLRIEERLDMRRVELTHDVLCGVVRASRDLRHEREARDEAERELAGAARARGRHAQGAGARAADRGRLRGAADRRGRRRDLRLRQHEARAGGRGEGRSRRA